jgi:hypothetical protein
MSDSTTDNLESNVNLDDLPEGARAYLKRIEKEVLELRPLKPENERYKLKEELTAEGMNLSNTQLKALLAAHDGEQTPSELRKTAEELKFVEPLPPTDAKDAQGHQAIDAARAGAQGEGASLPTYEDEVNAAQSMEQLQEIAARHGKTATVTAPAS